MKVLVVGSGGREHALVWKLSQSPRVKKIYAAPGNAGIAQDAECLDVAADDLEGIVRAAQERGIDLVVAGPELPLALGLVDRCLSEGIPAFGPTREAARLEGSKGFAKQLLTEEGVPTAPFEIFGDFERAIAYLKSHPYPVVLKADGLAAGKGVAVCRDLSEATRSLDLMMKKRVFGEAGREVLIEDFLEGREASFQVLVDGKSALPLASAQDHKRVLDGDNGPNTGGMGAYSPTSAVDKTMEGQILSEIIQPTLRGLKRRGVEFKGVLYAGLMLTTRGPMVLEFNVRFGDPEAQAIVVRMESDLVDLIEAAIEGRLDQEEVRWGSGSAVCVVLAAHGYPGPVRSGDEIQGLEMARQLSNTAIFHAGTRYVDGRWFTAGGRVLGVTAWGKDLRQARERVYDGCDKVYWKGIHYRRDIAREAI